MSNTNYRFGLTVVTWLFCASPANAQQATEVYIPIGKSPGVSVSESWTGVIRRIDYDTQSIEVQVGDKLRTVSVDSKTLYYIDRTQQRRQNSTGTLKDCEKGLSIEVWVVGDGAAEWIKIDTG